MPIRVLHEDERLIAVDKPRGQLAVPGRGRDDAPSLKEEVSAYLRRPAFAVHRLDREASGVLVFAKEERAHKRLCLLFERREVRKTYLAVVLGDVRGEGKIDAPLRAYGSGRMGVARAGEGGKPSLTYYKALEALRGATLLELRPVTGRRHQLRAHLFGLGHPILGDSLYGRERPVGGAARLMLHAVELVVPDWDGKELKIRAEAGRDFLDALTLLRAAS
ncbi:MAG: RluA family pseudouridine synthase [Elusimicrobia bacterium]|nr:RluA family pseudouridine synthase [Elusimicrobiota bacterium]